MNTKVKVEDIFILIKTIEFIVFSFVFNVFE